MLMQVMEAPDIRWSVLASGGGEEYDEEGAPGDEHSHERTGYDLEDFRLAVVEGKHPDGEVLSYDMPRWNIDDEDLADLAAFLKSPSSLDKGEKEMFPGDFSLGGWWIIFPIIGVVVMITFMFIMMGRRGFMGPRRDSRREPRESSGLESPLEILKKRYARGEISKEEYEGMKRDF